MARTYHIDIAVYAARADRKWVDNLLSHHTVLGVEAGTQGVARRISVHGIHQIALVHILSTEVGISVDTAVSLADRLLTTDANHVELSGALELRIDRRSFQRQTDERIAEAVESIVPRRRGRPPGSVAGRGE